MSDTSAGQDQGDGCQDAASHPRLGCVGVRHHPSPLRRAVVSPLAQGPPAAGGERDLPRATPGPRPSGLASVGERLRATGLSAEVVDTLLSARAGSTHRQYDSKWRQFEAWCAKQDPVVDPSRTPVERVLSFLQSILEQGRCFSTLKGLVAAISACQEGLVQVPVGQHRLVKDFLKAAKRRSATARPLVPAWDLAVVLDALSRPPFEPLEGLSLKVLTLKTLFLVAITTAKRVSDLRALSISERCFAMDPEGRRVRLQPDLAFVTKTQAVAQRPVELPAFHPPH